MGPGLDGYTRWGEVSSVQSLRNLQRRYHPRGFERGGPRALAPAPPGTPCSRLCLIGVRRVHIIFFLVSIRSTHQRSELSRHRTLDAERVSIRPAELGTRLLSHACQLCP